MKNQIQFIVDELTRPTKRPLVILMTSTHPMTDTNLLKTGHQFYNLDIPQFPIKWNGNMPENMHIIQDINQLPHRPDLIISQNITDQHNVFSQLGYTFDCPIIEFEHTVPSPEWIKLKIPEQIMNQVHNVIKFVYITDYSRKEWGNPDGVVLYHMVNSDIYKGWTGGNGHAAMMCNAFAGREWAVGDIAKLMELDTENRIMLFGGNPGFDSQVLRTPMEVASTLSEFDVFVNTSIRSPIPASLLEAASIGMPIVSTKTCAIPEFFTEGENIRYFETYEECLKIVDELLADKEQRERLGAAARNVILEKFNEERYVADWNKILYEAVGAYNHA